MHLARVSKCAGPFVADKRVRLPALPEADDGVDEFFGTRVPIIMCRKGLIAKIRGDIRHKGRHNVPGRTALAEVIKRSEASRQIEWLIE